MAVTEVEARGGFNRSWPRLCKQQALLGCGFVATHYFWNCQRNQCRPAFRAAAIRGSGGHGPPHHAATDPCDSADGAFSRPPHPDPSKSIFCRAIRARNTGPGKAQPWSMLDPLEKAKLIERCPHPTDRAQHNRGSRASGNARAAGDFCAAGRSAGGARFGLHGNGAHADRAPSGRRLSR